MRNWPLMLGRAPAGESTGMAKVSMLPTSVVGATLQATFGVSFWNPYSSRQPAMALASRVVAKSRRSSHRSYLTTR